MVLGVGRGVWCSKTNSLTQRLLDSLHGVLCQLTDKWTLILPAYSTIFLSPAAGRINLRIALMHSLEAGHLNYSSLETEEHCNPQLLLRMTQHLSSICGLGARSINTFIDQASPYCTEPLLSTDSLLLQACLLLHSILTFKIITATALLKHLDPNSGRSTPAFD